VTKSLPVSVTGGSGFIGSSVVDALREAGHDVRVLDPLPPHRDDVDWRKVDVLDLDGLTDALDGSGPVFHLAAMADVNDVIADPAGATHVNVVGTVNLLEAARRAGAGRVILASTVWVYDATRGERVDEATPFDPETSRHLYVSQKIAAELACRDYLNLYGRPFTVLRLGIPYGPRMRPTTVLASFFRRALAGETLRIDGDGHQVRNFVYVTDLARAFVLALRPEAENLTINLNGPEPVSIRRLAELTQELVPGALVEFGPSRPGDLAPRVVVSERAADVLGWSPDVSIDDGVRRTFEWYVDAHPPVLEAIDDVRRIAVVPAYNEADTVAEVLSRLYPMVDELVVVDDGSTDDTRAIVQRWLPAGGHARLLTFDRNQGMSAAYYLAFTDLRRRMAAGEVSPDDLVFTVDADGQHELDAFEKLQLQTTDEGLDALLVRRDLSTYPPYKQWGNELMSWWARRWSKGVDLRDVESGYRVFRMGALADALDYYRGYKYSETVEVAIVLSRLGYTVRNDVMVPVPVFRSRTRMKDVFIDLAAIPLAALRVAWRKKGIRVFKVNGVWKARFRALRHSDDLQHSDGST
jgi:UDP-glucose 4-epimerase